MDEKEVLKKLGNNIAKYRKMQNLKQLELALKTGVHPNDVSDFECGRRNLTVRSLINIADALDIPLKNLFDF